MTTPAPQRTLALGASRSHAGDVQAQLPRLAAALSASLGVPVSVDLAENYDDLLGRLLSGASQIAWMPPLLHAAAAQRGARLAAVAQRGGWLTFRSAVLVRDADGPRDVAQVRGLRAAWVDRQSASGYLFPRLELAVRGAPPEKAFAKETFSGSVARAGAAVQAREADLCACFVTDAAARDLQRAMKDVRRTLGSAADGLRILFVTDPIPPDGFVLSGSLDPREQAQITTALLALHERPDGREALREMMNAERLAPVTEALRKSLRSWTAAAERQAG